MAWIIVNESDPELLWSNVFGWVTENYDTFSDCEHDSLYLPMGGYWEKVNWTSCD